MPSLPYISFDKHKYITISNNYLVTFQLTSYNDVINMTREHKIIIYLPKRFKFYTALQLLGWFLTHYVIFILFTCIDYCTVCWVLKSDRVFT